MTDQQITLSDGRKLGFAEFGERGGRPVFYFHGWPGSRLEPLAVWKADLKLPAHLISVDRPGYGLSGFQGQRRIIDWPQDVAELATALGIKRFAVLGVSGGGPYAAACAALIPERVSEALLVCSMGPAHDPRLRRGMSRHNRMMLFMARHLPGLAKPVVAFFMNQMRRRNQFLPARLVQRLPASDKECLRQPAVRDALLRNWHEVFRSGPEGALADGALYAHAWGFEPKLIRIPVRLWHGEADIIVPRAMGRYLAAEIPGCRSSFLPEEGHFSLPLKYVPGMLASA